MENKLTCRVKEKNSMFVIREFVPNFLVDLKTKNSRIIKIIEIEIYSLKKPYFSFSEEVLAC